MPKKRYSCRELAELQLPALPGSEAGMLKLVKRENWSFREVHSKGGTRGIKREYTPPPELLELIHRHLRDEAVTEEEVIRARAIRTASAGQQTQTACASGATRETVETVVTLTVTLPASEAAALLKWLNGRGNHA
jgi:hypothetical protein